ncbi:unannotated protein [freshwater metagenome]|uniref:Unannotated protein n=1 Tax=freshwater metagenome TaxID=449393 RepID=A0A6J6NRE8_9ZZZZ
MPIRNCELWPVYVQVCTPVTVVPAPTLCPVPTVWPPTVNVTTPGTLGVAVNVTDCPATAGLGDIEIVVVVAERA